MANKYDLKTVTVDIAAAPAGVGEGAGAEKMVPKGKTRFVCFVKHSVTGADTVTIGEGTFATPNYTMVTPKDVTAFGAAANLAYPDNIDVDNPLMSIAEEQYLLVDGGGANGTVTIVYFDE